MQAVIFNRYGSADVLQLTTLAKPTPKAHEVLIRIHAAGANPADWRRMSSTMAYSNRKTPCSAQMSPARWSRLGRV